MEKISLSFFLLFLVAIAESENPFQVDGARSVRCRAVSRLDYQEEKSVGHFRGREADAAVVINVFMPKVAETYLARKRVSVAIMPAESL